LESRASAEILHAKSSQAHAETGQGLGASHQTGWTALITNLLLREYCEDALSASRASNQVRALHGQIGRFRRRLDHLAEAR
jgi:hypothetical protein